MTKALKLFAVQLSNAYSLNVMKRSNTNTSARRKAIGTRILFLFLTVYMAGYFMFFVYGIGTVLKQSGNETVLAPLALSLSMFMMLTISIARAPGMFFGCKDYDLLMSMPVSSKTVVMSKFLLIYTEELIYSMIIAVPCAIGCGLFFAPPFWFYIIYAVLIFVSPALPIAVGCLISFVITRISVGTRFKNVAMIVGNLLMVVVVFALSSSIGRLIGDPTAVAGAESTIIKLAYIHPMAKMFEAATVNGNLLLAVVVIACNVAAVALVAFVIGKTFVPMHEKVNASTERREKGKAVSNDASSPFAALYKKEVKYFFSQYMYVMNCGIGMLMLVVFAVYAVIKGAGVFGSEVPIPTEMLYAIVFPVIGFFTGMTATSSVSLSLEGNNLWILQMMPVPARVSYNAKIALNLTITIPMLLIATVLFGIAFGFSVLETAVLALFAISVSAFISVVGLAINLRHPKFDWVNPVVVIKQSISVLLTMLCGFALTGFTALLVLLLPTATYIGGLAAAVVMFAVTAAVYFPMMKKADKSLRALSDM